MANKWMQKAAASIKKRGTKGVFSRAAKAHGESTHEYAEEHKGDKGTLGKRARLALAFIKVKH